MLAFLMISTVASLVASLVLGTRLLRLASRTRELPELMIGSSFIVAGVIGYVVMLAGNPASGAISQEQAVTIFSVGYALIGLGVCCVYVFIWRTFRVTAKWAPWLAATGCLLVLATSGGSIDANAPQNPIFWIGMVGRVGAGAWGAIESLHWWMMLRRRLALGLADPVVANRFLLWGLANVATFMIFACTAVMPQGNESGGITVGHILMISTLTVFTAAVQWLAFFPSQRYLARIRRGHEAANPA